MVVFRLMDAERRWLHSHAPPLIHRTHAPRGYVSRDAPRPVPPERHKRHSHAERGNDGRMRPPSRLLHQRNFVFGQAVERIHQLVDLLVGRVDLALQQVGVMRGFRGGELLVQGEHFFD